MEECSVRIEGHRVRVSHYPPRGATHDERYHVRRPVLAPGQWLIHGHTHEKGNETQTVSTVGKRGEA